MSCKFSVIKACECRKFKAQILVREVTNRVQYLGKNVGKWHVHRSFIPTESSRHYLGTSFFFFFNISKNVNTL